MGHKKILIGSLILCLALGYLGYLGYTLLDSSVEYFNSVSELKQKGEAVYDQEVQVKGEVVPNSIEFNAENATLTFTITDEDEQETLEVLHKGDESSTLKSNAKIVLVGKLDSTGIFYSTSITTKCPSKYETAE